MLAKSSEGKRVTETASVRRQRMAQIRESPAIMKYLYDTEVRSILISHGPQPAARATKVHGSELEVIERDTKKGQLNYLQARHSGDEEI